MEDIVETPSQVSERAKTIVALVISFFAGALAVIGMGASNASDDAVFHNIQAANNYQFFQAKNSRQAGLRVAVHELETRLAHDPTVAEGAYRKALEERVESYKATIDRFESEPSTGEGKKELLGRASNHEKLRDEALAKDPYFDLSEALLQIGIVLLSVFVLTGKRFVAMAGGLAGAAGVVLGVVGFVI